MDVNEEFTEKKIGGGGFGSGGFRWGVGLVGGHGGCERIVGGRG